MSTPTGRDKVITKVQGMLDISLAEADARLDELDRHTRALDASQNSRQERYLQGLEEHLKSATSALETTDQMLADGEKMVNKYMNGAEAVRQRLAEWASRAIG